MTLSKRMTIGKEQARELQLLERAAFLYWLEQSELARRRREPFSIHLPSLKLTFGLTQKQLGSVVKAVDKLNTTIYDAG